MAVETSYLTERAPSVPGVTLGRLLGSGASAQVWSGIDAGTGAAVAVKLLRCPPERAGTAMREAALLARLDHEHLLRLHRAVDVPGTGLALVVELAPGGSLAALVRARGALDPGEVVTVLTPLAAAAAHLHGRGLVHGDIAPGNVLFNGSGRPLLADLGAAALLGAGATVAATPGFADPLLRAGARPTPADDVHAAGAVAWFCLTGRVPPPAAERPPLVALVPGCPPALAALVERCLDVDPTARPGADELARAAFDAAPAAPVRLVPTDPSADPGDVVTHLLRRDAATSVALPATPPRRGRGRSAVRARRGAGTPRAGHRRTRRRTSMRRLAAAVAAVVGVLAVLLLGAAVTGAGSPVPSPAVRAGTGSAVGGEAAVVPGEAAAPDGAAAAATPRADDPAGDPTGDPVAAVGEVSASRATAFATGRRGPLELADVAGSPALAADEAVLGRLTAQGTVLQGLRFDVRDVVLLERAGDAARVRVTTVTSAHRVLRTADGVAVRDVPESDPRTVELALRQQDGRWRVEAVVG